MVDNALQRLSEDERVVAYGGGFTNCDLCEAEARTRGEAVQPGQR
jgi:hypothetical protein